MSEAQERVEQSAEEKMFEFTTPIFGFPDAKRYAVLEVPGGGSLFRKIVAVDEPGLEFLLIFPYAIVPDYLPDIPEEELQEIGVTAPDQAVIMCIVTVPQQFKDATANLRAPLIFNPFTKKARQVILPDDRYQTRVRLMKA